MAKEEWRDNYFSWNPPVQHILSDLIPIYNYFTTQKKIAITNFVAKLTYSTSTHLFLLQKISQNQLQKLLRSFLL